MIGGDLSLQAGRNVCGRLGRWKGYALVKEAFLQSDGHWFNAGSSSVLKNQQWSFGYGYEPKWIAPILNRMSASPAIDDFSFIVPVGDGLVNEQPISDRRDQYIIKAVYQSTSKDGGKTWSAPIITPHAYIFELGRKIEDQSFVGRPLSFEGYPFPVPQFTKPQTPEEKEAVIRALPAEWKRVRSEVDPGL